MSKSSWRRVFLVLGAALLLGGYGYSAASNGGLDVYSGGIDMHSNDIVDGGTTVWDASKGYVPSSQVQDSFLKNTGDKATGVLYTSAGLKTGGNSGEQKIWADGVKSSNYLNLWDGALHSGVSLDLVADSDGGNGGSYTWTISDSDGSLDADNKKIEGVNINYLHPADRSGNIEAYSGSSIELFTNDATTGCVVDTSNNLNCDGSKNWIHSLNSTHEAVYTSQESGSVRAVYEGKSQVGNRTKIELPSHFSKTVSDTEPKLRATATVQGELAYAAVIEKTDDYVVLDSSEPATVNYRITGIREGYEDKHVVRKSE